MGCVNSKKSGGDAGAAGGDYQPIGVEKFDEIFNKAKEISEKGDKLKDGLEGQKMLIFKNTGMEWLKEPSLGAAVKCWVYSCAADAQNLDNFKPEVKTEEPFVEMPEDAPLNDTNKDTKNAIVEYMKNLVAAPETMKSITEDFQGVMDSANAAKDTAADDFSALGMMEKAKAAKNLAANMKKLKSAQEDLAKIPEVLKTAAEDAKSAAAGVGEAVKDCKDVVGKTKELTGDDAKAASRIAKEVYSGDKNDKDVADAYAKKNYSKISEVSTTDGDADSKKAETADDNKV